MRTTGLGESEKRVSLGGWIGTDGRPWIRISLQGGILINSPVSFLVDTGFTEELSVDYDTHLLLKEKGVMSHTTSWVLANGREYPVEVYEAKVRINGEWHSVEAGYIVGTNKKYCMVGMKFLRNHKLSFICDLSIDKVGIY
jgi:predicted aspartyl protease